MKGFKVQWFEDETGKRKVIRREDTENPMNVEWLGFNIMTLEIRDDLSGVVIQRFSKEYRFHINAKSSDEAIALYDAANTVDLQQRVQKQLQAELGIKTSGIIDPRDMPQGFPQPRIGL